MCASRYRHVVEVRFSPLRNALVIHPDRVRHVLNDNQRNCWRVPWPVVLGGLKRIGGED